MITAFLCAAGAIAVLALGPILVIEWTEHRNRRRHSVKGIRLASWLRSGMTMGEASRERRHD